MYILRRHRRPLLFPPGLLALGCLLLLGCLALQPWQDMLKVRSVLQLTVPRKPVSDYIDPLAEEREKSIQKLTLEEKRELEGYGRKAKSNQNESLHRYSQLAHFRSWQDFAFIGTPKQDAATAQLAQQAFVAMQTDKRHARGIRIHFGEQATYASLVKMLEFTTDATERYLLDFHHTPTTLYAFTVEYNPMLVDLSNDVLYPKPPPASSKVQTLTWQEALTSSSWRLVLVFLLGIMAVNCWKMARRWHTA